jgi:hypothetical protein
MTTKTGRPPAMKRSRVLHSIAVVLALALAAPALAQPRLNIAGNYRGMMTGCIASAQPPECRKGFTELVRLADDVDAKRAGWAAGGASAAKMEADHAQALERLTRAVADFNRDMGAALAPVPAR